MEVKVGVNALYSTISKPRFIYRALSPNQACAGAREANKKTSTLNFLTKNTSKRLK